MKLLAYALMIALLPLAAHAHEVKSEKVNVSLARVVELHQVSEPKAATQVSVVVHDLGGSTDLSPTQAIYLTVYNKGEMFSTDATFLIDNVFGFEGARRRSDGRLEVKALGSRGEKYLVPVTYLIDARGAVKAIEAITCEDFDCEASENFSASISVHKR